MNQRVLLGAIAVLQLAAALTLQLIVLLSIGPGRETDAYIAAQSVPLVLSSIVAISLQNTWQPRLAVLAENHPAWLAAQRVAQGQVLAILGSISLLAALTCAWWLPLLFPTFTAAQLTTAARLSWLLLAAGLLSGHATLYTAAQRARGRFLQSDLTSLLWSLIGTAIVAALVPRYGVEAAGWVSLVRTGATAAHLHVISGKALPALSSGTADSSIWRQLRPLLAGSALYKLSPLVDRYWAAQAGAGGLTVYNLALLAVGAIANILERSLIGPFSVRAAVLVQAKDYTTLRTLYRRMLVQITMVTAVVAIAIIGLRPAWSIIFTGLMDISPALSAELWVVSLLLLGYLHVAASGAVSVAIFYAQGDTRTPVLIGIAGFVLGLILKSLGFLVFGLPGLAAGTSVMFLCNLALFSTVLRKRLLAG